MNGSIAKYFKSPKSQNEQQPKGNDGSALGKECEDEDTKECSGSSFEPEVGAGSSGAGKPTKSQSDVDRMIAENMASVLKSLKKKRSHKCSKRRRNGEHKDKDDQQDAEEVEAVELVEEVKEKESRRRSPRKSTQDKARDTKDESSNRLHDKSTPDKEQSSSGNGASEQPKGGKENKKVNAFQLMMNSRNKAIGSNSPGKDTTNEGALAPEEEQKRDEKVKRKLKLEEWAERKGAGKRKIQEEAEEEFIAHQMNRRAKRLKKLIKNMEPEEEEDDDDEPVAIVETPRKSARQSKQQEALSLPSPVVHLKRGRRRLSSDDSVLSSTASQTKVEAVEKSPVKKPPDDEDAFVDKLSSPLKKKDSLLGYFNKVGKDTPSPEVTPVEEKVLIRKRVRGRPSVTSRRSKQERIEVVDSVEEPEDEPDENDNSLNKSSSRPRRSCAGKIKDYAVYGGTSPEKETVTKQRSGKKPLVTPLKIINVGSPQTMAVVKSPSVRRLSIDQDLGTSRSARSVKLAPLFVKKPIEDPEKVRAKQEFLMSGIPEKMRVEIEKQRNFEDSILNESPVFPLVSHVQQLVLSPKCTNRFPFKGSRIKILPDSPGKGAICSKEEEFEFNILNDCDDSDVEDILAKLIDRGNPDLIYSYELPKVTNVKDIVREWKQSYKHFPVFKCYKQFRAMYEEHDEEDPPPHPTRLLRKAVEDVILEESLEIVEQKFSYLNGELLFTEKYKPLNSEHILVNCQPAIALKKFLSSWKEDRASNLYDSGDEFEDSNSSMSSTSTSICNHMVLVGPSGCGKTCNVYAVANEMNFNVLELNASSRRKGKIILQELHEATQSHQVRRKDETVDIFKKAVANRKGSKNKLRKISTDSDGGASKSKKLSLILIEDADIVFDQDDGFVAAINQLISTSKRPIVLTTTDPNCAHLSRYISNNVIRYVAPGIAHVAKLLSILAIVEKVHIDQCDLARLYAFNRKDLRKTLNDLQFFIQSGGDRGQSDSSNLTEEPELRLREEILPPSLMDDEASRQSNASSSHSDTPAARKHRSLFRLFSRNQNEQQLIRAPLNFDNLWCNMERVLRTQRPPTSGGKRKKSKVKDRRVEELDELVFFYANVSSAALIQRDAKSVEDRLVDHLEEDMAHTLVEESWEHWFEAEQNQNLKDKRRSGVGAMCYDSLKQFDSEERQIISSYIGINPIRTRSTFCDYEPYLRTICRYERQRSMAERRGSRFYHYFRNYINSNPTVGTGAGTVTNFSVDHFDALSSRFEEDRILTEPASTAITRAESSDESR